jgi:hypothetical protein
MYDVGTCLYNLLRTRLRFLGTRLAVAAYISAIVYRSSLERPNVLHVALSFILRL